MEGLKEDISKTESGLEKHKDSRPQNVLDEYKSELAGYQKEQAQIEQEIASLTGSRYSSPVFSEHKDLGGVDLSRITFRVVFYPD